MDPMILILGFGGAAALLLLVIGLIVSARSDRSISRRAFGALSSGGS